MPNNARNGNPGGPTPSSSTGAHIKTPHQLNPSNPNRFTPLHHSNHNHTTQPLCRSIDRSIESNRSCRRSIDPLARLLHTYVTPLQHQQHSTTRSAHPFPPLPPTLPPTPTPNRSIDMIPPYSQSPLSSQPMPCRGRPNRPTRRPTRRSYISTDAKIKSKRPPTYHNATTLVSPPLFLWFLFFSQTRTHTLSVFVKHARASHPCVATPWLLILVVARPPSWMDVINPYAFLSVFS